jgi:hypothetical protein
MGSRNVDVWLTDDAGLDLGCEGDVARSVCETEWNERADCIRHRDGPGHLDVVRAAGPGEWEVDGDAIRRWAGVSGGETAGAGLSIRPRAPLRLSQDHGGGSSADRSSALSCGSTTIEAPATLTIAGSDNATWRVVQQELVGNAGVKRRNRNARAHPACPDDSHSSFHAMDNG